MLNDEKDHELGENIYKRMVQIMKNIKTEKTTVKQLKKTISDIKHSPGKEFSVTHKSKEFFEKLWENDQK
jgi:hypothetical protein